jgi:hypothetical protein
VPKRVANSPSGESPLFLPPQSSALCLSSIQRIALRLCMARKSVSRGPNRPAYLAEPTSARSTALDQTTSRADVAVLDRRSSDDAGRSDDRKIPIQDYASGTSHLLTLRWGYALVFGSASVLAVGLWSILIGPLCEPTGIKVCKSSTSSSARSCRRWTRLTSRRLGSSQLLDVLVQDDYYKYLVILLVPVTVCFVIINWWGLKVSTRRRRRCDCFSSRFLRVRCIFDGQMLTNIAFLLQIFRHA